MKTLEQFKSDIEERIRLSSGWPGPLGENLRAVINYIAQTLYAQQTEHEELMARIRGEFDKPNSPLWEHHDRACDHEMMPEPGCSNCDAWIRMNSHGNGD